MSPRSRLTARIWIARIELLPVVVALFVSQPSFGRPIGEPAVGSKPNATLYLRRWSSFRDRKVRAFADHHHLGALSIYAFGLKCSACVRGDAVHVAVDGEA